MRKTPLFLMLIMVCFACRASEGTDYEAASERIILKQVQEDTKRKITQLRKAQNLAPLNSPVDYDKLIGAYEQLIRGLDIVLYPKKYLKDNAKALPLTIDGDFILDATSIMKRTAAHKKDAEEDMRIQRLLAEEKERERAKQDEQQIKAEPDSQPRVSDPQPKPAKEDTANMKADPELSGVTVKPGPKSESGSKTEKNTTKGDKNANYLNKYIRKLIQK